MIGIKVSLAGKTVRAGGPGADGEAVTPIGDKGLPALLSRCDYAFQPIVNIVTGQSFGYEALLRDFEQDGISTQRQFFDACAAGGSLDAVQIALWEKAVSKFVALSSGSGKGARLFLNMDSRSLDGSEGLTRHVKRMLAHSDLPESAVALEISETPVFGGEDSRLWVRALKRSSCKIAIDRFGGPSAGLSLLHAVEPDFVKIDPLFVRGVTADSRKKLLLSQMVTVAHLLGIIVVAVGVETEGEFLTVKELGCDLVQGFLVGEPSRDAEIFPTVNQRVETLARQDRRCKDSDRRIILDQLEPIAPLPVDAEVVAVFDRLRSDTKQTFVPIVDPMGQPLGIVRETNLKNYAYSPFGKDLISNKGLGRKLKDFVVRCPVADIHMPVEDIMSIFSGEEDAEGIILVDQMRYVGFLSARSIIRVINEKSLALARDQNPLTKLPGNALINQFVNQSLANRDGAYVYAYVDFDNFKPFNDQYGFRQGDRAILLFAELMRKTISADHFLGHIGGDDFFIGFRGLPLNSVQTAVIALLERFRSDAESFYDAAAREKGCIGALDREGNQKCFPLLSASAVLVNVAPKRADYSVDDVSTMIASKKKQAKSSPIKVVSLDLGEVQPGFGD